MINCLNHYKLSFVIKIAIIFILFSLQIIQIKFIIDDSYISYRYAENLARGNGLTYNPGEKVEGYSNFLWVLLISSGIKLGLDPVWVSKMLGMILGVCTVLVVFNISSLLQDGRFPYNLISGLIIATSIPFALWSVSGLETSLYTFLIISSIYFIVKSNNTNHHKAIFFPLILASVALCRPEGVVFSLFTLVYYIIVRSIHLWRSPTIILKKSVYAVGVFAAVYIPYIIWKVNYYGQILPNTVYAKDSFSHQILSTSIYKLFFMILRGEGVIYVLSFLKSFGLFFVVLALIALLLPEKKIIMYYLVLSTIFFFIVSIWNHGDWMPEYRLLVPAIPVLALLLQEGLIKITQIAEANNKTKLAYSGKVLFGIVLALMLWNIGNLKVYGEGKRYTELVDLGVKLRQFAISSDTLLTFWAGIVPYYSGIYTTDMLGLTDEYIAHYGTPVKRFGKIDWNYVLSKKPTFILIFRLNYFKELIENKLYGGQYYLSYTPLYIAKDIYLFVHKERTVIWNDNFIPRDSLIEADEGYKRIELANKNSQIGR